MLNLPQSYIDQMAVQLGDELPAFLRAMEQPAHRGIRLNPMKAASIPPDGLLNPVPWEETGHYIRLDTQAGAGVLHEAGAWYLQEPSAMLPAALLDAKPGETVLDLCAAPGGKATQSALKMRGQGLMVANEPNAKRAQILSRNIERMGIPNAVVVSALPDQLADRWPAGFDAVLVDAPCSGEGMFRRHPETISEWKEDAPDRCAARQQGILDSAAALVRPGGRMVYATCTFHACENEETIVTFLQRHPEFHLQAFALPGMVSESGMRTVYPHRDAGEGQFAALLIKAGDGKASLPEDASLPKPDKATLRAFVAEWGDMLPTPTHLLGKSLIHAAFLPDLRGIRVLRAGLHVAEAVGKRWVPDHAAALAFEAPPCPRIELTEAEARAYQHGETLQVSDDVTGWVLPTYGGLALGWGKVSGGMMKNHYPKGLRK